IFVGEFADPLACKRPVQTLVPVFDHADRLDQVEMSGAERNPVQIETKAPLLPFLIRANMKLARIAQDDAGNEPAEDVSPLEHDVAVESELGQGVHIAIQIETDHF